MKPLAFPKLGDVWMRKNTVEVAIEVGRQDRTDQKAIDIGKAREESGGATYPRHAIRFSVLWKAEVQDRESTRDTLTLDRIMDILVADLRNRGIEFQVPSHPLVDTQWILLLQRIYVPQTPTPRG